MTCSFCGDPAASPATGCQYGERMLACRACVLEFWAWAKQHTNSKARRRRGVQTMRGFYECATSTDPRGAITIDDATPPHR